MIGSQSLIPSILIDLETWRQIKCQDLLLGEQSRLEDHDRTLRSVLRYWEILPKEILKRYWEILPKEILKRYWEILPKEILKRYWEILPKEILGDTTQRDIEEILGDTTQRDIEEILGVYQRDIE
ncbi:hypothetical protein Tco_0456246 [Tanacetum coccineum]